MFEGNEKTSVEPYRRRIAIRTVAPASKFNGSSRRSHAIDDQRNVGPASKKLGLLREVGINE